MKRRLSALCYCLLLTGCVTSPGKQQPQSGELTGWVDMAAPLSGPVQVTISILARIDGKLLPLAKSHFQVSHLPLKYDFRKLPLNPDNGELFVRAELRRAGNDAVQARKQLRINLVTSEKIMLIPLPCFPDCKLTTLKE